MSDSFKISQDDFDENCMFELRDTDHGDEFELIFVKHGTRFTFRCRHGHEAELLGELADHVRDPDNKLDWFDAAVISHQMGQKLKERLGQMIKRKTG
ncbi:hypothetical protein JD969_17245 [Planctomycetota bacterium]|nr:hypothetical protein JD969_17245 [Planctomycetota bacterium]